MSDTLPKDLLAQRLPDWYRDVSVDLTGELVAARREAIEALTDDLALAQAPAAVAYAHGRAKEGVVLIDAIRKAARATDPAFASDARNREPQVMMACVVAHHLATHPRDETSTALSLLVQCAAFRGFRSAAKGQDLVGYAQSQLHDAGESVRRLSNRGATLRSQHNKRFGELAEIPQTGGSVPDNVVQPWISALVEGAAELATRVDAIDRNFRRGFEITAEGLDQTAWLLDEHCEIADAAWADLNNEGAALYAAYELAALTQQSPGPAAASVMLQSTLLKAGRNPKNEIDPLMAVTKAGRRLGRWPTAPPATHDLAPLSASLGAYRQVDGRSGWRPVAKETLGAALPKATEADIAEQGYRELLLAAQLADG